MKNGLQLFNFRRELVEDFRGALKEIAKLGFDGVEYAVFYGDVPPEELAAYAKELKLECAGTMFNADDLLDENNVAYKYATLLNSPAVTISTRTTSDFTQVCGEVTERCRKIGINAAKHNLVFSYHNHWAEFTPVDGIPAMYRILDDNDPAQVWVEPDVCWLMRGGVEPVEFIRRYAKRMGQIHLKDSKAPADPAQITELGCGIVDITSAYAAAKSAGVEWAIYEQDTTEDPFRSAEISLKYLKKLQAGC